MSFDMLPITGKERKMPGGPDMSKKDLIFKISQNTPCLHWGKVGMVSEIQGA